MDALLAALTPAMEADRARFRPGLEAAEEAAAAAGLVLGGAAAALRLQDKAALGLRDPPLEFYTPNAREAADALVEAARAALGGGITVRRGAFGGAITVEADMRRLAVVRGMRPDAARILRPVSVPLLYGGGGKMNCFGPEVVLADLYMQLIDPESAERWPEIQKTEKVLRQRMLGKATRERGEAMAQEAARRDAAVGGAVAAGGLAAADVADVKGVGAVRLAPGDAGEVLKSLRGGGKVWRAHPRLPTALTRNIQLVFRSGGDTGRREIYVCLGKGVPIPLADASSANAAPAARALALLTVWWAVATVMRQREATRASRQLTATLEAYRKAVAALDAAWPDADGAQRYLGTYTPTFLREKRGDREARERARAMRGGE